MASTALPHVVFGFGTHTTVSNHSELLDLAAQADGDGLEVFSISDHPYLGDRLDAYAAIGFVLGRTQRLTGFANVSNLPIRTAPLLARTVASLSALSGGRIVLGVGAGGLWDRIADLGVTPLPPAGAVAAFEEGIQVVRALTGGGAPVTIDSDHHHLTRIEVSPIPTPPVWTGSVGPKSLAVTGRVADGWIPGHAADWHSERYLESRPVIDRAAREVGRDPREIRTVFNVPGRITARPLSQSRNPSGRWIGGSVEQWVDELTSAALDHGAGGFLFFSPDGGAVEPADLARWAREIVPAVRAAVLPELSGRQGSVA